MVAPTNGMSPDIDLKMVKEKTREVVKEKEKIPHSSPPRTIKDGQGGQYVKIGFLGEGGFARVYEMQDQFRARKAVKVVAKASVRTKKNKTKLWAEIKLHQMLRHPHIVMFKDCFEDEENVYMVLELCENGSMMDLLRRRKRYTEPEVRYYLVQLIAACQHMHQNNVIHRDLKLGNLFLDADMEIKVGDFGLAALIEKAGDRKKTICGTPNYIAPEVLFDTANGHSFEVDVWSIGVIMYTLLIGKPPFQTKDVKAIYKRIRENRYEFPADREISSTAQNLIMSILNPNPDKRPSLDAILADPFFLDGPFPAYIPVSANDIAPDFRNISASQSRRNFEKLCQRASVGVQLPINTNATKHRTALGPSILQQERDFNNAVQPDSPISALLNSARKPLLQAPSAIKEPSLLRKLSAAGAQSTLSPVRRSLGRDVDRAGPSSGRHVMDRVGEEDEEEEEEDKPRGYDAAIRERELANQKARIVSQMAGSASVQPVGRGSPRRERGPLAPTTTLPARGQSLAHGIGNGHTAREGTQGKMKEKDTGRASLFDIFAANLTTGLTMSQTDVGFSTPNIDPFPPAPRIFVVSWLDYCNKYGMGFAMTDGTVSVHFNDSTSLVLAPGKKHFDHIQPSPSTSSSSAISKNGDLIQGTRDNYTIDSYPKNLDNKVYLLKHFENYMMDRLFGDWDYTFEDLGLTKGMVFVTRYLRMKHVILFRLSNDVLQFNFYDHTKLILSSEGLVVSVIDKHYILRTWSLAELLRPIGPDVPMKDRRRIEGVIHKVGYARDVLSKIKTHLPGASEVAVAATKATPVTISQQSRDREREMVRPIR